MADIQQLFNVEVPAALAAKPEEAKAIGGKYQLNITGAGNWTIDLTPQGPSCVEGEAADAGVTITVTDADFQTLLADPGAGMKLFFAGKLKVKGNQMLAMNLQKLLKLRA
jgi:putative sterol carrier protein